GYDVGSKAFELAALNVTTAYTKELKDLGFNLPLEKVIEGRIFNVGREQVQGLASVGVTNVPFEKLVEFQIFHVTPEDVRALRAGGFNVPVEKMVEMRVHGATPEFMQQMAAVGYKNL